MAGATDLEIQTETFQFRKRLCDFGWLQNRGNLQVFKIAPGESGWLGALLEKRIEITTRQSPYETPGLQQFQRNQDWLTGVF